MKRSSCEITMTPPFQALNASIRPSRPSKSRWLVGCPTSQQLEGRGLSTAPEPKMPLARTSSSSKMCGRCNDNTENATRDFWPPLRAPMGCNPVMPVISKLPSCCRYSCSIFSWEPVREKLNGVHRRDERVHAVLCKVAAASSVRVDLARERIGVARKHHQDGLHALRLTCPDNGFSSPVRSLTLVSRSVAFEWRAGGTSTRSILPARFEPTNGDTRAPRHACARTVLCAESRGMC
jgi:hypothetical protein